MMNLQRLQPTVSAVNALVAAVTISAVLLATFLVIEPTVSRAQADTATFTITQQITDESSFLVNPTDVYMVGSINGVSGGQATGTTQFVVQSNNATGYYVEIAFFDNVGQYAMIGTSSGSEAIRDYGGDVAGEPSYGFTASTAAQFAYTVTATSTTDLDQSFLNNSAGAANACNSLGGSQYPAGPYCWKSPATAAYRIIDRSTSAITGATSTITFRVNVPSGASPVPEAENYVATATLSLFTQ